MEIIFNGGSETIRQFTKDKFSKFEKFANNITNINVIFKQENVRHIAEASIHVPNSPTIYADCESEDMYKTIDLLIDKLSRQLVKYKERKQA